jgi:hypothetical protein
MALTRTAERKLLAEIPNALAYHRVIETRANGYLVRQFIHSSLYDRLRYVHLISVSN